MMIYAVLIALLASASLSTAQSNLDPTQLAGWQNFFTKTGGTSWTRCAGKRNSPCTCEGTANAIVTCEEVDGVSYITSIKLRNNNLVGPNVPGSELEAILSGYEGFTSLDLGNNAKLRNTRGGCLNIPSCNEDITCTLDYPVCASGGSVSPTSGGGSTAAPTPTPIPSGRAWRNFFDATGGSSWTKCSTTRATPCECQKNQPATASIKVVCAGAVINRVSLVANNLNAPEFPSREVGDLILAGATYVDLSSNTGLGGDATCFDVPECAGSGVTCIFSKPVCGVTSPPGVSPTADPSDTESPSESPETDSPTTAQTSPTTSVPATKSPTTGGSTTKSPTTGGSTTNSPSVVAPPSNSPASGPATTGRPTTASPNAGGSTKSPTSSTSTKSPTAGQATSSPVIGVQTSSPTTDSAGSFTFAARSVFVALAVGFAAILA